MLKLNLRISLLLGVMAASSLLVSGCGAKEPVASTPDEVKAFGGDPAVKEKMGASIRDRAMQNSAQNGQRASDIPKPATP